ncbi:MAG: Rieske 2Fe-2S domain-containing protein [Proteobacteria bacterium]|nr:Rieske 2Fe-2S domain-containing protein [Pseudomonadota bacterium]
MASRKRLICQPSDLKECGRGVRFATTGDNGEEIPGFVIRHNGLVFGYVNRCAHLQVELDWQHGEFFDADQELLICATHGALYLPGTGECIGGPCKGVFLTKLVTIEEDGGVYLVEE